MPGRAAALALHHDDAADRHVLEMDHLGAIHHVGGNVLDPAPDLLPRLGAGFRETGQRSLARGARRGHRWESLARPAVACWTVCLCVQAFAFQLRCILIAVAFRAFVF